MYVSGQCGPAHAPIGSNADRYHHHLLGDSRQLLFLPSRALACAMHAGMVGWRCIQVRGAGRVRDPLQRNHPALRRRRGAWGPGRSAESPVALRDRHRALAGAGAAAFPHNCWVYNPEPWSSPHAVPDYVLDGKVRVQAFPQTAVGSEGLPLPQDLTRFCCLLLIICLFANAQHPEFPMGMVIPLAYERHLAVSSWLGSWAQVNVPTASMQEILPAARLLSRATALTPSDYERAKAAFLSGVDASRLAAQVLRLSA